MRARHLVWTLALVLSGSAFSAYAQPSINFYPMFLINGPLAFNGNSGLVTGGAVPMINGTNQKGSFWVRAPQDVTQSFSAQFDFFLQNAVGASPNGGDGLAFVIQGDPRGLTALGAGGAQIGYGDSSGGNAILGSLGVAILTGGTDQIKLYTNTNNMNLDLITSPLATQAGTLGNIDNAFSIVNVNYTAPNITYPNGALSVLFDGSSIGLNNVALPASLQSLVGGPTGLFGFTSASDATNGSNIQIMNFTAGAVPEPASLGIACLGGIALLKRRPRRV
jgi:hypothetical protein